MRSKNGYAFGRSGKGGARKKGRDVAVRMCLLSIT